MEVVRVPVGRFPVSLTPTAVVAKAPGGTLLVTPAPAVVGAPVPAEKFLTRIKFSHWLTSCETAELASL